MVFYAATGGEGDRKSLSSLCEEITVQVSNFGFFYVHVGVCFSDTSNTVQKNIGVCIHLVKEKIKCFVVNNKYHINFNGCLAHILYVGLSCQLIHIRVPSSPFFLNPYEYNFPTFCV